ncbi:MAG TPA: glycosyltransferase family 39 protein [Ignavibacteriaceae bacterium]|nr:glycosyltransferase family 39 protein [Ignavibacteriaceae bacterium]
MNKTNTKNYIYLILVVGFLLNLYSVWWGLPSVGGRNWAPDEISPVDVYRGIASLFSGGWHERYPPLHFYILTVFYLPFVILDRLGAVNLYSQELITTLYFVGRMISVIMGTALIYVVYKCGKELADHKAGLYSAIIAMLICPLSYYSKTTNLDVPYLFWFTLSLLFFIKALKHVDLHYYLLFTIFAVFSLCTKDQSYGLFFGMGLILLVQFLWFYFKNNRTASKLIFKNSWISILVGIVVFLLIYNVIFNYSGFIGHIKQIVGIGAERQGAPSIRRYNYSLSSQIDMFLQSTRHLIFLLGIPFFIAFILGMVYSLVKSKRNLFLFSLILIPIGYYLTFMIPTAYNYDRHIIPIAIISSLFGGVFFSEFLHKKKFGGVQLKVSIFIIISLIYLYKNLLVGIFMDNDSRYEAKEWITNNVNSEQSIAGLGGLIHYYPRINFEKFSVLRTPSMVDSINFKPDYLITSSAYDIKRYRNQPEEVVILTKLKNNELGYKQVKSFEYQVKWNMLNIESLFTNLDKINPRITIYKRVQ